MAHIPYGYRIKDGNAVIDESERRQVIALYKCFITGASYRQCQEKSGVERTPKGCKSILSDRTYLGTDFYPAMIDEELFTRAAAEFERRGPGCGGRKKRTAVPVRTAFFLREEAEVHSLTVDKTYDVVRSTKERYTDPFAYAAMLYARIIPMMESGAARADRIAAETMGKEGGARPQDGLHTA